MIYLVMFRNEDDVHVKAMDAASLSNLLDEVVITSHPFEFLDEPPSLDSFPEYSMYIIKGDVVIPKPKKVVIVYDL